MNHFVLAAQAATGDLSILNLAMKGGWIMIVLAVLSVIGIYIFFERFSVIKKATTKPKEAATEIITQTIPAPQTEKRFYWR